VTSLSPKEYENEYERKKEGKGKKESAKWLVE